MTARSLLIRGPSPAEPPEAQRKTVPVGKRTASEVPEKVVPRRTGIRRTRRSCSAAATSERREVRMRYYLGVDWADQTHAVWVGDERGPPAGRPAWARGPGPRVAPRGAGGPGDPAAPDALPRVRGGLAGDRSGPTAPAGDRGAGCAADDHRVPVAHPDVRALRGADARAAAAGVAGGGLWAPADGDGGRVHGGLSPEQAGDGRA